MITIQDTVTAIVDNTMLLMLLLLLMIVMMTMIGLAP